MQSVSKPRLGASGWSFDFKCTTVLLLFFSQAILCAEVQLEKTQHFDLLLVLGPSAYPSGILIKEV